MNSRESAARDLGTANRRWVFLFVLILWMLALPSFAQSEAQKRDRNRDLESKERIKSDMLSSQFRFGRVFVLSKFGVGRPSLPNLTSFTTINFDLDQELYIPTTSGKDDIVISLNAPQRVYVVLNRKMLVSVDAVPSFLYYFRANEFSDFGWLVKGDVHFLFNRLYLDFYTGLSDQLARSTSELQTLVPEKQSNWGSKGEIKVSSRTEIHFGATRHDYSFSEVFLGDFFFRDITDLDRTETSYDFLIKHQTFPVATLALGGLVKEVDFDSTEVSNAKQTTTFLQFASTKGRTTLTVTPGYSKLDYDDPSLEGFSGFTGSAKLERGRRSRWSLGLSAERRLEFSLFGRNNYFAADRIGVLGSRNLGRRLEVHGSVERGRNSYFVPTPVTTLGDLQTRVDDLEYESVGFLINIAKLKTGLTLGHWKRDSNVAGFDDDGIRLQLHLSFSLGIRAGG